MITHSKPDAQGNYEIRDQLGRKMGDAYRTKTGFGYLPGGATQPQHFNTMAALKASLLQSPEKAGNRFSFGPREEMTPLVKDKATIHVARFPIVDATITDPLKKFFGLGWVFERIDGTFDRAHNQMDGWNKHSNFPTLDAVMTSIVSFEDSPEKIWACFDDLVGRLSPENLCCDGEISRSQVKRRYNQIMREWKVLEKKLGRRVDMQEAEAHCYKNAFADA